MTRFDGSRAILAATLLLAAVASNGQARGKPRLTPSQLEARIPVINQARREYAAKREAARHLLLSQGGKQQPRRPGIPGRRVPGPGGVPDYFGAGNWAFSPRLTKFIDSVPLLNTPNNLGQQLPVAQPDKTSFPGADYYEIGLVEYTEQLHSELKPTKLRGYVQLNGPNASASVGASPGVDTSGWPLKAHYLGPTIVATKDRPVRMLFRNLLPTGDAGKLFIPVDKTTMGAGMGPNGMMVSQGDINYSENRATVHLHGARTPWISDGTAHQWITPAGEVTDYPRGVSASNVPDMWFTGSTHQLIPGASLTQPQAGATNDPGPGSLTFYYTNQQSARLLFYHDHAFGITRLNVYVGEAAGYLITDPAEQALIASGGALDGLSYGTPLIIQDKSFIDTSIDSATGVEKTRALDPTWPFQIDSSRNDLWFPHVWMPNTNPASIDGMNPFGRWDYGPWFWPPWPTAIDPVALLNSDGTPQTDPVTGDPVYAPGVPDVSQTMEFMADTAMVNGTAFPYMQVDPKAYRFRVLNAANDRMANLTLWISDPANPTEVRCVPAVKGTVQRYPAGWVDGKGTSIAGEEIRFPSAWTANDTTGQPGDILDGRDSGVPDPILQGPPIIQIGTEGGFLPYPVVYSTQMPQGFDRDTKSVTINNVKEHNLFLGPAERADIVIDFSKYAGKTIILYNDSIAPVPATDSRLDYYTGQVDQTDAGGCTAITAGAGPNTRTLMQFRVGGTAGSTYPAFDVSKLQAAFAHHLDSSGKPAGVFETSQPPVIIPQGYYGPVFNGQVNAGYNSAYGKTFPVGKSAYARMNATSMTFNPLDLTTTSGLAASALTMNLEPKCIQELFEDTYGRMTAYLGTELKFTNGQNQTTLYYGYHDPAATAFAAPDANTEIQTLAVGTDGTQIWKITHNGVDTHPVHFHLFDVQVINRVGWDFTIRPTEPNELGWKDTVRMNPLEDIIVAARPRVPSVPFDLPNSVRPLDPTMPIGATDTELYAKINGSMVSASIPGGLFRNIDNNGNPGTVSNQLVNYGWEYVWHCHILSHEEMDMMSPMAVAVARPPTNVTATQTAHTNPVRLAWTNPSSLDGLAVQRADDAGFTRNVVTTPLTSVVSAYTDNTSVWGHTYYYRVRTTTTVGAGMNIPGYPTATGTSGWSATAQIVPPIQTVTTVAMADTVRGQTGNMTGTVTVSGSNAPLSGVTVSFTFDGASAGTATTNSNGVATLAYTVPASTTRGTHNIGAAFAGSGQYDLSSGTGTVRIYSATTLTIAMPATTQGQAGTMTATLTDTAAATAVSGKTISFTFAGSVVGTATTNSSGRATLSYTVPTTQATGSTAIGATFAGDTSYGASSAASTVTVKARTSLVVTMPDTLRGSAGTLSATLTQTNSGAAVSGASITFSFNGTSIGTATTNASGVATRSYTVPAAATLGSTAIGATWNGNNTTGNATATGSVRIYANTHLTVSMPNSLQGDTATMTATLTDSGTSAGISGKTVTFSFGGSSVGTGTTDASGVATLAYTIPTTSAVGTVTIGAAFAADASYAAATATGSVFIKALDSLAVSMPSTARGSAGTITALLTRAGSGSAISGATVSFSFGGATVGTGTTNASGVATYSYTVPESTPLGSNTIGAAYAGDANNWSSSASNTVDIYATTSLAVSMPDTIQGEAATMTATLTANGTGVAGKSVTFSFGGTSVGTGTTDNSGVATLSYTVPSSTTAGSVGIGASFAGDTEYAAATATNSVTIKAVSHLTVSMPSTVRGSSGTLSATLTRSTGGAAIAGATVSFTFAGASIGTATTDGNGTATLAYTVPGSTATGSTAIGAAFSGDSGNSPATATGTVSIYAGTGLTVSMPATSQGATTTMSATLTDSGTSTGVSGKTVTFTFNGNTAGTGTTDASGIATLSYTVPGSTSAGTVNIGASFAGDATYSASTATGTVSVTAQTSLTVSMPTTASGAYGTLTATLTRTNGGAAVSGATVSFSFAGSTIGTGTTNSSGVATYAYLVPTATVAGTKAIGAGYAGDASNAGSTGTGSVQVTSGIASTLNSVSVSTPQGNVVKLYAYLTQSASPKPAIAGATVRFLVSGTQVGTATTDATGYAYYNYTVAGSTTPGGYTLTYRYDGDATYSACVSNYTLTVLPGLAETITVLPQTNGSPGLTVPLTATAKRPDTGAGIVGQTLSFSVGGLSAGTATTDSTGTAILQYSVPAGTAAGTYPIVVSHAADGTYVAASGTNTLTVTAKAATSVYCPSFTTSVGRTIKLYTYLYYKGNGVMIAGQTVTFRVNGTVVGTGVTDANGYASLNYTVKAGDSTCSVTFAGTATLATSTASGTITLI